jgi:head-tail adaptor
MRCALPPPFPHTLLKLTYTSPRKQGSGYITTSGNDLLRHLIWSFLEGGNRLTFWADTDVSKLHSASIFTSGTHSINTHCSLYIACQQEITKYLHLYILFEARAINITVLSADSLTSWRLSLYCVKDFLFSFCELRNLFPSHPKPRLLLRRTSSFVYLLVSSFHPPILTISLGL